MHAFEYTCANGQTQSPKAKESPSITQCSKCFTPLFVGHQCVLSVNVPNAIKFVVDMDICHVLD